VQAVLPSSPSAAPERRGEDDPNPSTTIGLLHLRAPAQNADKSGVGEMEVRWISETGVEEHPTGDLELLLARDDGFVWVDVPECDEDTAQSLSERFRFHPLAVRDVLERRHVPKIHAYPDHLFIIVHAPEAGEPGHVHLIELDQFIGGRYLVTIHGPLGRGVTVEMGLRETMHVLGRIESGRLRPTTPFELSYAIVAALAHRHGTYITTLASQVATLERRVREGDKGDPVRLLEELFLMRHELLSVRTNAAESREVYARMAALTRMIPPEAPPLIDDLIDRFDRVKSVCDGEREFMQGIIDFYQVRTTTRMNMAMERLALIAAVLLPVTAIASIYGMNIIVQERSDLVQLGIVLALMAVVVTAMLAWSKRLGWW
jgi:Mg2+ and Co2+ transporter CorA